MDNNLSESKRNLSRAPQETELGSVPVSQWPSPYKRQVRNLEFQLTSVCVRPPLAQTYLLRYACAEGVVADRLGDRAGNIHMCKILDMS